MTDSDNDGGHQPASPTHITVDTSSSTTLGISETANVEGDTSQLLAPVPGVSPLTPSFLEHPRATQLAGDPNPFDEQDSPFLNEPRHVSESPTALTASTILPPRASPVPGGNKSNRRSTSSTTSTITSKRPPPTRQSTMRSMVSSRLASSWHSSDDDGLPGAGANFIPEGMSALVTALNAIPYEAKSDTETDSEPDEPPSSRMARTTLLSPGGQKPKNHRMHSSLHTIRAMDPLAAERADPERAHSPQDPDDEVPSTFHQGHKHPQGEQLRFPYRENVIARRAREPEPTEMSYQLASSPEGREHRPHIAHEPPPRVGSAATLRPSDTRAPSYDVSQTVVDDQVVEQSPSVSPTSPTFPTSADAEIPVATQPARRSRLSVKLREVFGLDEAEEVIEELPCWLLRSIMLKGYMFLTQQRICFFAHMPGDENSMVKSGPLWKKASRTKLSTKFWFVLRNDVLSWYESSNDPYFPKGNISLQYASSCDVIDGARFKIRTAERNYTFTSETAANATEWVRAIGKVMFKTQHEGESVKVIIPLETIVDLERSPTLDFAETIEVKVVDADDSMSVDSYFFASFPDNDYAYDLLDNLLRGVPAATLPYDPSAPSVQESVGGKMELPSRFGVPAIPALPAIGVPKALRRGTSDARVPIAAPLKPALPEQSESESDFSEVDFSGYPPQQRGPPPPGLGQQPAGWGGGWMRNPTTMLYGSSPGSSERVTPRPRPRPRTRSTRSSVTEVVEPVNDSETDEDHSDRGPGLYRNVSAHKIATSTYGPPRIVRKRESDLSIASGPSTDEDTCNQQFREYFTMPATEELYADISGSLYRVLPVHGRFYVSDNYFCFRSSHHLISKTKMIVPIRDLYGMKAQKGFVFAHHGLIIIIKGHEELFLEFSSKQRRSEVMAHLQERMDEIRKRDQFRLAAEVKVEEEGPDMDEDMSLAAKIEDTPMFSSTTSTLLEFKPQPMKVICLTIGSRGDVQPYIALCKGLQAEGHTTTIATHGEYKDWVEGHGIGFTSIGGDPAELMQMCVDNGMFTVAFLKEGLQKFRGWLDDLLMSSWEACQGADLLIESPSAMAGLHIAEALRIPYYRAFTMPWTRTRLYPQAFAVPEHKRGGSYNYMTYVVFDQVFWRAIAGQINRWRRKTLNIEATNLDKMEQDKVPFLYNFSPSVVPPPLDWTEWIHITGYWFLDNADGSDKKTWEPPAGLLEFIDGAHAEGKKVVYIGFGSIVVSDPAEMTRCVVEAIVESGVCAILTKGWSDRGNKDKSNAEKGGVDGADGVKYPKEIYALDSIDHSWLFPRIDAACHHGGAGTTGASLRAGIPTIIKPFFGDQSFWAERVESLGVGAAVHKLTAEALAAALREATTNGRQIAMAKSVGEAIRQENGVSRAIASLYRDLEYAKSLIKPEPQTKSVGEKIVDHLEAVVSRHDDDGDLYDHEDDEGPTNASMRVRISSTFQSITSISSISSRSPRGSTDIDRRSSHNHSRGVSTDREAASDGSWSVVSDDHEEPDEPESHSLVASPSPRVRGSPHMRDHVGSDPASDDEPDSRRHSLKSGIHSLGELVKDLLPSRLSRERSREAKE